MWDAAAPVTVRLADFVERAQGVEMDPAMVLDWKAHREPTSTAGSGNPLTLPPGDRVCFTGAGAGRTRGEWQQEARAAGCARSVTSAQQWRCWRPRTRRR